jgi:hypothetical protein
MSCPPARRTRCGSTPRRPAHRDNSPAAGSWSRRSGGRAARRPDRAAGSAPSPGHRPSARRKDLGHVMTLPDQRVDTTCTRTHFARRGSRPQAIAGHPGPPASERFASRGQIMTAAIKRAPELRGGAGGARTHDRRIMRVPDRDDCGFYQRLCSQPGAHEPPEVTAVDRISRHERCHVGRLEPVAWPGTPSVLT